MCRISFAEPLPFANHAPLVVCEGNGVVGDEAQDIFAMMFESFDQVVHGGFGDPARLAFFPAGGSMGMLDVRLGKNAGVALFPALRSRRVRFSQGLAQQCFHVTGPGVLLDFDEEEVEFAHQVRVAKRVFAVQGEVALETIVHESSPVVAQYAHFIDRLAAAMIAGPQVGEPAVTENMKPFGFLFDPDSGLVGVQDRALKQSLLQLFFKLIISSGLSVRFKVPPRCPFWPPGFFPLLPRKLLCFGFACDERSLLGGLELFALFFSADLQASPPAPSGPKAALRLPLDPL